MIDHAIKALSEGSEVGVNIPHRVNRVFGRQLSVVGLGSIRSMVAVFDYKGRLYQIEGKSVSMTMPPPSALFNRSFHRRRFESLSRRDSGCAGGLPRRGRT